jgi:NAD(P)-dependent dehydrogenase (short-subunit alcohol dehydrogenase family)
MIDISATQALDLSGMAAVVTGAGHGIAKATALRLAQCGAVVAALDIDLESARDTAAESEKASGKIHPIQADVSEEASVDAAFEEAAGLLGRIDILANVVGKELYKEFMDISTPEWDSQLAVNLRSVFLCSRRAIPHMIRNGAGSIVNTASVQALATTGSISAYAAAKGGMIAMTRDMARDLGRFQIRINTICPGVIQTPMLDRSFTQVNERDEFIERLSRTLPLGRIGSPLDVANLILFLISPLSSYITGTSIVIDGGMMCRLPLPE